jgi:hypothetical protein
MKRHTLRLALAVLLVACARQGTPQPTAAEPGAAPATKLEIDVWPAGERKGERMEYTLTCEPVGGTHPDPGKACASLEKLGAKGFAPVPADRMCTQQYGGPMQARVRGVVAGQTVDARLAYTDGCQISRWDRLADVVPFPRGTSR